MSKIEQKISTATESKNTRDFDHLISLLEFEVNRLETAWSRSGWSLWALLAGLATTLWLVTAELERSRPNLSTILFLFLLYSLLFDCLLHIFRLFSDPTSSAMPGRFIRVGPHLTRSRPTLLLETTRNVILLFMMVYIANLIPWQFRAIIYAYLVIFSLIDVLILGLSLGKGSIPPTPMPAGKLLVAIVLVFLLPAIIPSLGLMRVLWLEQVNPTLQEYRLAGLFAAGYVILFLLVRGQRQTPLLQSLIEMRRSIALGQLDVELATRQVDIALQGMTTSDVFQADLAKMLGDLENGSIHLEYSHKEIQACLPLTIGADLEKYNQTRELVRVTLTSVNNHLRLSKQSLDLFSLRLRDVRTRAYAYSKLSAGNVESLSQLENKLSDSFQAFLAKRDAVLAEKAELERSLASHQPQG